MPKPIPVPDELSKPFWDAINERRLTVQRCTTCSKLQYPPRATCASCGASGDHLEWREVQGRGHILGNIVVHDTRLKRLYVDLPHNLTMVSLDEDPGIIFFANLPGTPVDEVQAGAPVEVVFEEVAPGQLIHDWQVVR